MKKTKIDWCDYSWNPVIGCQKNCYYCYAKSWAKRFGRSFEPHWSESQYKKPYKIKKPSKIFVCSLADLFGDWIPNEWIEKVLRVVKDNPQHTFQFLTKNPKRYLKVEFPKNCWLGVTIDGTENKTIAQNKINILNKKNNYKFISVEPLLGDIKNISLNGVDQVIVGAMTGGHKIAPKKEWIGNIKHPNIFYKKNIKKYLQQTSIN